MDVYGPQTPQIEALLVRARTLTTDEIKRLGAAWGATRDATRDATWGAAWGAWDATWDAACALVVRDLIGDTFTQDQYDTLTGPWRRVIGPVHPDDAPMEGEK